MNFVTALPDSLRFPWWNILEWNL